MRFSWEPFLAQRGIDYEHKGHDLYIKCVFCGSSDSGKHLGISLRGRGFGCWKNQQHRGRSPTRLVAALLGVGMAEAARIVGIGPNSPSAAPTSGLSGILEALKGLDSTPARAPLKMPPEFCRAWGSKSAHLFISYLMARGITPGHINRLIEDYDLHYAMRGDYTYRIVIPVRNEVGELYTWTARSIADDAKPKYKTLTCHSEKAGDGPLALGPITDMLLGYPALSGGGEILVIAEGPFDCLNLSLYASATGSRATCLFGKAVSAAQIDLLADLRHSYEKVFLLLDPDAVIDSLAVSRSLTALGIKTWTPDGDRDPGEMQGSAIRQMLKEMRAS